METPVNKHNAENERIKRDYVIWLRESRGRSEPSLDQVEKALDRFETYTKRRSFKEFRKEQAVGFKNTLARETASRSGLPLSLATRRSTLMALRQFFEWLATQPGYRSRVLASDASYFRLLANEDRAAQAFFEAPAPSLPQIRRVLSAMPVTTTIDLRNRALIAFTIVTGCRDGALTHLRLKHIDIDRMALKLDAREIRTKFGKSFPVFFFPVGADFQKIVAEWIDHLLNVQHWSLTDPLFPATDLRFNTATKRIEVAGIKRAHWANSTPIRRIFKNAFQSAGLPYFNPHSFRKTLAVYGETHCRTIEELKCWSQNLGHDHLGTTLASYGTIGAHRQEQILRQLDNTMT